MVQNGKTPPHDKQNWALCPYGDGGSLYLLSSFPTKLQSSSLVTIFSGNFPYLQYQSYYFCIDKEVLLRVNIFIISTAIWRSGIAYGSSQIP